MEELNREYIEKKYGKDKEITYILLNMNRLKEITKINIKSKGIKTINLNAFEGRNKLENPTFRS